MTELLLNFFHQEAHQAFDIVYFAECAGSPGAEELRLSAEFSSPFLKRVREKNVLPPYNFILILRILP